MYLCVRQAVPNLGTRVEIKNLNSFRALERSAAYQIAQQIALLENGGKVRQETLGWDENAGVTYSQRGKEEAHDYRYFPEPDLPPVVVEPPGSNGAGRIARTARTEARPVSRTVWPVALHRAPVG
jgi:Asp-tRNA(Asn)/Glu-tRNA(Gln) amidotransferase B subunit